MSYGVVVLAVLAGVVMMALAQRYALAHLRKNGRPGCEHVGALDCGECGKRLLAPVCPHCASTHPPELLLQTGTTAPDRIRVTIALQPGFMPFVELDRPEAQKVAADLQSLLESEPSCPHG